MEQEHRVVGVPWLLRTADSLQIDHTKLPRHNSFRTTDFIERRLPDEAIDYCCGLKNEAKLAGIRAESEHLEPQEKQKLLDQQVRLNQESANFVQRYKDPAKNPFIEDNGKSLYKLDFSKGFRDIEFKGSSFCIGRLQHVSAVDKKKPFVPTLGGCVKPPRNAIILCDDNVADIDQSKSHPRLCCFLLQELSLCTGLTASEKKLIRTHMTSIQNYIEHQEEVYDQVRKDMCDKLSNSDIKKLHNILAYGGGINAWRKDLMEGKIFKHFFNTETRKWDAVQVGVRPVLNFKLTTGRVDEFAESQVVEEYREAVEFIREKLYKANLELAACPGLKPSDKQKKKADESSRFLSFILQTLEGEATTACINYCVEQGWIEFRTIMYMWDGFAAKFEGNIQDKLVSMNAFIKGAFGSGDLTMAVFDSKRPSLEGFNADAFKKSCANHEYSWPVMTAMIHTELDNIKDKIHEMQAEESKNDYPSTLERFKKVHAFINQGTFFLQKIGATAEGLDLWSRPKNKTDFLTCFDTWKCTEMVANKQGEMVATDVAFKKKWAACHYQDRQDYNDMKFVPRPLICPPGTFNSFRGLRFDNYPTSALHEEDDDTLWKLLLQHISEMIPPLEDWDKKDEDGAFITTEIGGLKFGKDARCLLDAFASIVQSPADKIELMFFLYGPAGCGKSMLLDVFVNTIGEHISLVSRSDMANVVGDFNGGIDDKLVITVPELQGIDPKRIRELMEIINGKRVSTNTKGIQSFDSTNSYHTLFCGINELSAVPSAKKEWVRRSALMYCSDRWCADDDEHNIELDKYAKDPSYCVSHFAYLFEKLKTHTVVTNFKNFSKQRNDMELIEAKMSNECAFYAYLGGIIKKYGESKSAQPAPVPEHEFVKISSVNIYEIFTDWYTMKHNNNTAFIAQMPSSKAFDQRFKDVVAKDHCKTEAELKAADSKFSLCSGRETTKFKPSYKIFKVSAYSGCAIYSGKNDYNKLFK